MQAIRLNFYFKNIIFQCWKFHSNLNKRSHFDKSRFLENCHVNIALITSLPGATKKIMITKGIGSLVFYKFDAETRAYLGAFKNIVKGFEAS